MSVLIQRILLKRSAYIGSYWHCGGVATGHFTPIVSMFPNLQSLLCKFILDILIGKTFH